MKELDTLLFPDGVPTSDLQTVSLSRLHHDEEAEGERCFQALREQGGFYLQLCGNSAGELLLANASKMFLLAEQLFDTDLEPYNNQSRGIFYGYKRLGADLITEDGGETLDRHESYMLPRDDIFGVSTNPLNHPSIFDDQSELNKAFMLGSRGILFAIFRALDRSLRLPTSCLERLHRLEYPSGDQTRLLKAPPQPPNNRSTVMNAHTDLGTITVIFNRLGGLQLKNPEKGWEYVKPMPGCCLIMIGDAMQRFSGGVLKAPLHRVVPPPGNQAAKTRYSVVFLCRPEHDVLLKCLGEPALDDKEIEGEGGGDIVHAKTWMEGHLLDLRVGLNQKASEVYARATMK